MTHPERHLEANERLNFANENGYAYGFVERRRSRISLEKLGASQGDAEVGGITVIWFAASPVDGKLRVVGWYEKATAYREAQDPLPRSIRRKWQYSFKAKFIDAHLIPIDQRSMLEVPAKTHRTDRGYIGQRFWFFPEDSIHYGQFLESFRLMAQGGVPPRRSSEEQSAFQEGQRSLIEAILSARNPRLVAAAKQEHGFDCQVCGFNFERQYGPIGKGFIEAHHKIALASKKGTRLSSVDDINVLCANCHRMVHKEAPPIPIERLRRIIREL
jgi:5-methylcytosine-specific restriction protein A